MTANTASINSPVGKIGIQCSAKQLLAIRFLADGSDSISPQSPLAKKVCQQLRLYFQDPQHKFQILLHLAGTDLQQRIWQYLLNIPSGETMTYGAVAAKVGTHPRIIGQACKANPIPVIVLINYTALRR